MGELELRARITEDRTRISEVEQRLAGFDEWCQGAVARMDKIAGEIEGLAKQIGDIRVRQGGNREPVVVPIRPRILTEIGLPPLEVEVES